jgi:hypothetical protein
MTTVASLDELRIATPCHADWDEMTGDERVRFCARCEKSVYNISAMPRAEAEAFIRRRDGRVCIRLYRRRDGTVITGDCPDGTRRQRLTGRVWASLSGLASSLALLVGLWPGDARADLSVGGKPAPTSARLATAPPSHQAQAATKKPKKPKMKPDKIIMMGF